MHEVIPYILIIIGFHPDAPPPRLVEIRRFESQEECELHGNEYVAQRAIYEYEFGGERFRYFCRRVG
jgi:hypothetical protein